MECCSASTDCASAGQNVEPGPNAPRARGGLASRVRPYAHRDAGRHGHMRSPALRAVQLRRSARMMSTSDSILSVLVQPRQARCIHRMCAARVQRWFPNPLLFHAPAEALRIRMSPPCRHKSDWHSLGNTLQPCYVRVAPICSGNIGNQEQPDAATRGGVVRTRRTDHS